MNQDTIAELFKIMAVHQQEPVGFLVDPRKYAMLRAAVDFAGRDWRRIKREIRKAGKRT